VHALEGRTGAPLDPGHGLLALAGIVLGRQP